MIHFTLIANGVSDSIRLDAMQVFWSITFEEPNHAGVDLKFTINYVLHSLPKLVGTCAYTRYILIAANAHALIHSKYAVKVWWQSTAETICTGKTPRLSWSTIPPPLQNWPYA